MSRIDATAALNGSAQGFVSGMAWLPAAVLEEAREATGSSSPAQAHAVIAASVSVDLAFVTAADDWAADTVESLHSADVAAVWAVDGVLSRLAGMLGWSDALRLSAADPGSLAGRIDEALHEALTDVRRAFEVGADAVLIADELAGPAGPLVSPDFALDALVPCYRRLATEVRAGHVPAAFHSDGDVRVLFPALAKAGFSAMHLSEARPDVLVSCATAARREGLAVLGGIVVQELAAGARGAGERAAALAVSLGGFVVCDDGGITSMEEVAALGAALDEARDAFRHPRA